MSENTHTQTDAAQVEHEAFGMAAGLAGAAAFADAETREIMNLLGEQESGGACCGGSCCA